MPGSSDSTVGFDAGWRADFRADGADGLAAEPALSVGREQYDAELRWESDGSFRAATFSLAVDGLTDPDYEKLAGRPCPHVTVALGWRDTPGTFVSGLANLAGALSFGPGSDGLPEVFLGRITRVERTAGDFRYRTTFTGVDAAFARLRGTRSRAVDVPAGRPLIDYLRALCGQTEPPVEVVAEGDQPGVDGRLDVPLDLPLDRVILHLAQIARGGATDTGVPLFLRGGRLHVGTWVGPVDGGTTHPLDASTGLVDVVPVPAERPEPAPDNPYARTVVDAFTVTLLGRPDIQVGDVVELAVPAVVPTTNAAASVVGALGVLVEPFTALTGAAPPPAPRPFRVLGLTHQLGRSTGFTTTLRVERQQPRAAHTGDPAQTSEAHRLAEELDTRARQLASARRPMDVGLVNRQTTAPQQDGTMAVRPQRLQLRSGLADRPAPNVPVDGDLMPTPTQLVDKPYLTPFAFRGTGLVIPHYPGARVLHLNHQNDPRNAVVAGCLWDRGEEPESKPGDWWLTLPTGVGAAESSSDPAAEPAPTGKVSSDLIDARGVRAVAVRALHIGVGEQKMPGVGQRPADAAVDEVVISSAKGNATIRFDADGNIEISTSAEIRFTARKVTFDVEQSVEVQ
ncbi:hypothetical protein [Micromonospora sp. NPDC049679]|uniref:hypothetical protein n=1 Tax=Micromonospora sp. NPDC049679 TaxID=3155920 RepID=UPI0033C664AB